MRITSYNCSLDIFRPRLGVFQRLNCFSLLGSSPNLNAISELSTPNEKPKTFVERIQGLSETLLGHHKSDCDCSTKGKSGNLLK